MVLLFYGVFLVSGCGAFLCYSCFAESDNSSCVTNPRGSSWVQCFGQCQVWRLYSEADLKIYMFERSCGVFCRTGCIHLADIEHRFVGCSSCCTGDFCNIGSGADYASYLRHFSLVIPFFLSFEHFILIKSLF